MRSAKLRLASRADQGIAMITVIVAVMVLTALGATAATLSINNLGNANRDRQAGSALGAADAGVAQAIEYIRDNGVSGLTCPDANQSSCTGVAAGWGSPVSPQAVALDSAGNGCLSTSALKNCATVYITYVTQFAPPTVKTGVYAIHSLGRYGPGPGARAIVQTVKVTPDSFPVGVFGQTVSGNGGPQLYTESLFTTDCVSPLYDGHGNGTRFVGSVDPYYDQPPAAHSTTGLSTTNNTTCGSNDNGLVPSSTSCSNSSLMWDQGPTGGVLPSTSACYRKYTRADGTFYPDGTCPSGVTPTQTATGLCDTNSFTTADLKRYGYRPRGLTDAQYQELKTRSQSENLYNLTGNIATALSSAVTSGITNPVLYWDCSVAAANCSGGVSLKQSDFPSTFTQDKGVSCGALHILTIVVEHADFNLSGGNSSTLDAAVFAPDGSYNNNGAIQLYGTLFSKNLSLTGSPVFELDSCWTSAFPGPALTVTKKSFREDDTKDLS